MTAPNGIDRIAQFEKMASADPTNEMAHFSLGNAYLQAGRHAEAAQSFVRCTEIVPDMSKAYQLAGQAMLGAGWEDKAVELLGKGYEIASSRGDRMPAEAMAKMLRSIGREPPQVAVPVDAAAEALRASGTFVCQRTGRPGTKLAAPPFRGPVGLWIGDNISAETWRDWIGQGTKVINELRLDFSRDEHQAIFDQHMREYLGIDEAAIRRGDASPPAAADGIASQG
ncbi:MAG: Fe(2+)-trafficking protein [Planctomycetota bacterium]|nr:Fe(2+)-trafficking protein [Planctomycetota bacterium]MDA1105804.1 Fe(2+)-trafficking protein [Planctomycetota bacterium]